MMLLWATLVGAWVAVWLERVFSNRAERRRMRRDVLRRLAAHRYVLTEGHKYPPVNEFWAALNEVVVAFIDDRNVMKCLSALHRKIDDGGFEAEDIVPLIQAMALAAKLPVKNLDSDLILYPFAPPSEAAEQVPPL